MRFLGGTLEESWSTFFQWYRFSLIRVQFGWQLELAAGAIDNPDQSGQVFEQSDIPEVLEKIFSDDFSMACHQKNNVHFWYFQGLYKQFC